MTREEIGAVLKELRLKTGKTQKEVAELLGRRQQIVGHWETGYSQPDANTLFTLCDIYGTTVDEAFGFKKENVSITKNDIDLLGKYHALDSFGQETVSYILNREIQRMELKEDHTNLTIVQQDTRTMQYYQRIASAGSGEYLFDDIPTDTITVESTSVSDEADFVIGVNGQSMEPTYYDGDLVFVKKASSIPVGEIGIFTKGNECFIKELGKDRLISHNTDKVRYPDIFPDGEIRLVGAVLGKAEKA